MWGTSTVVSISRRMPQSFSYGVVGSQPSYHRCLSPNMLVVEEISYIHYFLTLKLQYSTVLKTDAKRAHTRRLHINEWDILSSMRCTHFRGRRHVIGTPTPCWPWSLIWVLGVFESLKFLLIIDWSLEFLLIIFYSLKILIFIIWSQNFLILTVWS